MTAMFDLLLKGGTVFTPNGPVECDVAVSGGRIAALGNFERHAAQAVHELKGLTVLPGVIDSQVHFREPGLEHKEDLESGTRAAALGGVTALFEMPNTNPSTLTAKALNDKLARAEGRAWTDFAFYMGAAEENADKLAELEMLPGCSGVKIFMGSSTGSLLVEDDESLRRVLSSGRRRVAVHAEDEVRLRERLSVIEEGSGSEMHPVWRDVETAVKATKRLLALSRETGRRVHVLHITTGDEVALLAEHKDMVTCEVTPQHLTLSAPECYERLGALAQMNPPIRDAEHREALWEGVRQGVFDVLGSDHAPHTRDEKEGVYPRIPSGMPGVQTLLPLMLDHVNAGRLTLQRLVDMTSAGPQRIFGLAAKGRIARGYDADFTVVDMGRSETISSYWLASKCGWSPFEGMKVKGWPVMTIIRGETVMQDGELLKQPSGQAIRFQETIPPQPTD
ncbi:MAG: dihydroorotase [Pseudomonadota bacterium]|uniref:dihydroorotase n=1 Tax=Fodinicurvata fenggangensis TaxID=1121830 RepID=UPI00047A9E2E|nr:dihydroorotase [Fodinicurvata fenggangensis]